MVEQVTRVYGTGGILSVDTKSPSDRMSEIIPGLTPVQLAVLRDYLTRSAADIAGIRSDMDREVAAGKMRFMARLMEDSILDRQQQGSQKKQPPSAQAVADKAAPAPDVRAVETMPDGPPLRIA